MSISSLSLKTYEWVISVYDAKWIYSSQLVHFSCSVVSDSLLPHDCSTPDIPVHHQLPEFTQIHVHWVSDAIQPSHPPLPSSPPSSTFPSIRLTRPGLTTCSCTGYLLCVHHSANSSRRVSPILPTGHSTQVTKVLELQHQYFQWIIFRTDFL